MDIIQFIIAIPWFAGGLFFWPAFLIFRGTSDARGPRLRRIFFITLGALAGVAALLGIVALLGQFNHNWLPVTLLFPLINLISMVTSILRLVERGHVA